MGLASIWGVLDPGPPQLPAPSTTQYAGHAQHPVWHMPPVPSAASQNPPLMVAAAVKDGSGGFGGLELAASS